MIRSALSTRKARQRLDLGGGDTKDKLMIAGLAAIIILAIVLVVIKAGGNDLKQSGPDEMTYICANCDHTFTLNREERAEIRSKQPIDPMMDEQAPPTMPCPECGENAGFRARICPKCGTPFLSNRVKRYLGRPVEHEKDTCPGCGTVISEWYREHGRD